MSGSFTVEDVQQWLGQLWLENKIQARQIRSLNAEVVRLRAEVARLSEDTEATKKPPEGG